MKAFVLPLLLLASSLPGFSQVSELTKANECFDKKDYQCAVDNYLVSLDKKTFKEGQQYLVEFRIAKSYDEMDQLLKAVEYYKKTASSKPDLLSAYWGLGDAYYDLDQFSNAADNYKLGYEKATEAKDKEDFTWWMGNSYLGLKQQKMVIAQFLKIQSREGKFIKTDGYIADAYFNLKKFDSALFFYQKYLGNLKPTDSVVKVIKTYAGKCYRELGKTTEAMEHQDAALAINPNYTEALWEKGILFANKKEYPAAIEQYKKALANLAPDSTQHYTLCGNIAACFLNIGNYAESVAWQQKRKSYSTNKFVEYAKIASLQYGKLKLPKEAEKTALEAINAYPLEPAALKTRAIADYTKLNNIAGILSLERKDTVTAQKYFAIALQNDKNSYEANARSGSIAWARNVQDDIKKYYNAIYKTQFDTLLSSKKDIATVYGRSAYVDAYYSTLSPSSYKYNVEKALEYDSMQKEAIILWPRVLLDKGSYSTAAKLKTGVALLDKAAKTYAADAEFVANLYNAKAVMLDKNDTTGIRTALETAVKICPTNIEPWDNLLKYYASYDNAKGVVMVEKLIDILKKKKDNITTSVAYVHKGDFLWRLTKKDDAKKAWQEALVWDANNATAKERVKM